MTRIVYCDFCSADLTDGGWECPARDFDFDSPRVALNGGVAVHGSVGSWLACDTCAPLVRDGERVGLFRRSLAASGAPPIDAALLALASIDLRDLHDQFWANREGEPVRIDAAQVALIAVEPAEIRIER